MDSMKTLMATPNFFVFLIFVICTVLAIGSFEKSLQNMTLEFVVCMLLLLHELVLIYLLCHFATNLSFKSAEMANIIYYTRWYSLPVKHQKMIALVILQGQVPFEMDGYIFYTSLETFMKVSNQNAKYFQNILIIPIA